ncbi:hypothetical protein BQ8482_110962 [Mesorhizobium delmotii]|uniref:Uncharacterized protein n=1 Tax=Mesorhizobium delmotii TaxID=1631247 RepID=A0A2P9AD73_9HYPH|nr:hypothetical protein BQ8482_110962 [Mesorhizobium delmotii]
MSVVILHIRCRCMHIPARYCTGYLGDIGIPRMPYPTDFNARLQAHLSGHWFTFDARLNQPRIGRILMAKDVARLNELRSFRGSPFRSRHRRDPSRA